MKISNPDKALFPDGTTKKQLVEYYERVADVMLPHVRRRPMVLYRCPDGIEAECFYQKQVGSHFPEWIDRVTVTKRQGGEQTLVVANRGDTVAWLANQGAITLHLWESRADALEYPDRLVVDLDPPGMNFAVVRKAARRCRELLDELGMRSLVMTTGSRGLHVVVPLDGEADFEDTRAFLHDAMDLLARRHADELTTEVRKEHRAGRLYLDVARNAYGQTSVAPYSVRALRGAPVATPLEWDELGRTGVHARSWTIHNLFRRLGQRDDPWSDISTKAASIRRAAKKLESMRE
jgi:bifunctional non-homologous end joining protein LigD